MLQSDTVNIDDFDLKQIHDFAVDLARQAGQILINDSLTRNHNIQLKKNAVDIVTETDLKIENFIKLNIQKSYPDHKFIGEESYSTKNANEKTYLVDNSPTWIVDPLDGTVNFVHLFPMTCISIGFTINGKAVAGAIFAPFINQMYSAHKNGGAWLNETTKLPLQQTPISIDAPKGCIFSCEWGKQRGYTENSNLYKKVNSFINMAAEIGGRDGKGGMVHGVRSLGSASLDLCFVATGAFDIWWEAGCWEWDVCAGFIIVEEAGGIITTANPPTDYENVGIPPAQLGSRLYLAIRGCTDNTDAKETSKQSQERVIRQVWKRVDHLDYTRPGV
ncbi:inositol monophosphatase [Scheffersomyces coipomensis]|uniref:inositol monophosphatase n=1 Tax=Scheffersomyces coipomensis TaxID=1788519 RepID=UPI00315CD972